MKNKETNVTPAEAIEIYKKHGDLISRDEAVTILAYMGNMINTAKSLLTKEKADIDFPMRMNSIALKTFYWGPLCQI